MMISKLLFILSFVGILSQNISKVIIVINFKVNQDYIAKNLCINRDKPKSCCAGSCQLEKELSKEEQKESKNGANTLKDKLESFPSVISNYKSFVFCRLNLVAHFTPYLINKHQAIYKSIFHPPSLI